ncbi:phosphate/phosphite/phosphonate ABC transporter substrate-binding protein [Streptomyces tibetensis]|uniref:Phosphate/phosphite/phosphonate ABC transporter substrate-binding protein n=1 Tax=Streptomyces tibetensis TaxID=2382123 RepID=A0ABW6N0K1_9ACTN
MTTSLVLGAVAYDPKVVTIWDGFRTWFRGQGFAFDYVLYSHYERQVTDLLTGRIDAAWNSPLAWVRSRRLAEARGEQVRAVAMRDTDCDLTSVVVVRADSSLTSPTGLSGSTLATGAVDSPQATLLPLEQLRTAGHLRDVRVLRFDIGTGLHGDHIGGERAAVEALMAGKADAACLSDTNLLTFSREGLMPSGAVRVIAQTDPYDHCNMTAGPSAHPAAVEAFTRLLLAMDYADAEVRPLLDLEGLKEWRPGRLQGYTALERAVSTSGFYDERGRVTAVDYRP